MLYVMLDNIITSGQYTVEDMTKKLNTLFAYGQLTEDEYRKLMDRITPKKEVV